MAKKKYIGITIGPIFDTMNLTSSPVALWASSYIFSMISKTLCECLVKNDIAEEDIVTPFFKNDEPLLNKNDGVGLFHDRIIFASEGFEIDRLKQIKSETIQKVAENFGIDDEYLEEYIMISAAQFEAKNPIMESAKILDSLELSKSFVAKEKVNPILALFSGDKCSKNSGLRNTSLVSSLKNFQLKKGEESFKSLSDIVATGKDFKKYKYYAIIRSDGDNMSKIISELADNGKIREFSKTCLEYCSAVADKVAEFDGVTIYSGGDDLLAILPCESRNSLTPFHFVKAANEIFDEHFKDYNQPTSLSFGITLAYYKFPLYEALEGSASLLFGKAKQDEKSRIAVRLQKHAGQSEGLIIPNKALNDFLDLFDSIRADKSTENQDKVFLSAIHKVALFETAFNGADDETHIYNLFENVFDADEHKGNIFLHEKLPAFFVKLKKEKTIKAIDNDGIVANNPALALCFILRTFKFFVEKGGEE